MLEHYQWSFAPAPAWSPAVHRCQNTNITNTNQYLTILTISYPSAYTAHHQKNSEHLESTMLSLTAVNLSTNSRECNPFNMNRRRWNCTSTLFFLQREKSVSTSMKPGFDTDFTVPLPKSMTCPYWFTGLSKVKASKRFDLEPRPRQESTESMESMIIITILEVTWCYTCIYIILYMYLYVLCRCMYDVCI